MSSLERRSWPSATASTSPSSRRSAGYTGGPHEHTHPEFLYVLEGSLRTQDQQMHAGDAYAASAGSKHTEFSVDDSATYLVVFKL